MAHVLVNAHKVIMATLLEIYAKNVQTQIV